MAVLRSFIFELAPIPFFVGLGIVVGSSGSDAGTFFNRISEAPAAVSWSWLQAPFSMEDPVLKGPV